MSFDVIVLDPAAQIGTYPQTWLDSQPEEVYDPAAASAPLQGLYRELLRYYPTFNGPDAWDDAQVDARPGVQEYMTEYCFGPSHLWILTRWKQADALVARLRVCAPRYGITTAWVSGAQDVLRL